MGTHSRANVVDNDRNAETVVAFEDVLQQRGLSTALMYEVR